MALQTPAFETLFGGSAGGGKSDLLVAMARLYHRKCVLFRRAFPDLERSLILRSLELYGDRSHYNAGKHVWTYEESGQRIEFAHLKDANSVYDHQCFHPDTELLTERGWVSVADVTLSDNAATLDPKTREMVYRPVTALQTYDYDGDLITGYQTGGLAFAVTPNHKLWYSTGLNHKLHVVEAQHLPKTAFIPQWADWRGEAPPARITFQSDGNNGRRISFTVEDWLEFMGWYLSEGSLDKRYCIRISQVNDCGRERIEACLQRMGVNYWTSPREFRFGNKALHQYLSAFGRSGDKYVPADIKQYPPQYLRLLLDALIEGDGTWYKGGKPGQFVSSSKRLADDVSEIAFKCGFRVTIKQYQGNKADSPYGTKPRWHVIVGWLNKRKDTAIRPKAITRQRYTGKVYCVTVPPYHTVLTRYRGRISWSGQSAQYDLVGFDEVTQFDRFMYRYMLSRARSTTVGQRVRIIACTNPGNEGNDWVMERWAPWLDEGHPHPAIPGEVRWFKPDPDDPDGQKEIECAATDPEALSRTFIASRLDDNPYLPDEYRKQLNSLPEPWRSQLRDGKWSSGLYDDPYQIVPTEWIRAAQARWTPAQPGFLTALGVDPARGGQDSTVLAPRAGNWIGRLVKVSGRLTPTGYSVVQLMLPLLTHGGTAVLDVIGIGSAVEDAAHTLNAERGLTVIPLQSINVSSPVNKTDKSGKIRMVNLRAWLYWKLREALDPEGEIKLALPPDPELLGELRATKWETTARGVKIIDKDDIKDRIGRSPNCADAVSLSLWEEERPRGGVGRVF